MNVSLADLFNPSSPVNASPPAEAPEPISKSRRIRDYLAEHPEASNGEVLSALEQFGIKYGDVANTRQLMKKQAGKGQVKRGRPPKTTASSGPAKNTSTSSTPAAAAPKGPLPDYVDFALIESGLEFIRRCGDIDRAEQVISVIRKIRDVGS